MNCVNFKEEFSFPPKLRLRKPADYKKVFDDPVKSTDRYFTVLAVRNHLTHPRLGLAIAKKNIRKAVERNRIKRTVRESFRLSQHQLGHIDFVVLARRDAELVCQKKLTLSLERHWHRLADRCDS